MAPERIPTELKRFILGKIKSVEALEALLLLYGNPDKEWKIAEVSRALYTSLESAATRLAELAAGGLLAERMADEPAYRYAPADPNWRPLVTSLEQTYRERRVSVITLIYSQPHQHIRAFSDAFRFRKEEK